MKPTVYSNIRAARCKGCADALGINISTGKHWSVMNQEETPCTAPTRDEVIVEQSVRIADLELYLERSNASLKVVAKAVAAMEASA